MIGASNVSGIGMSQPPRVEEDVDLNFKSTVKKLTFDDKPSGGSTKVSTFNPKVASDSVRAKSEEELYKDSKGKEGSVKIKVLNIPEVGLYEGNCVKGVPHGEGKLKLKNGDYYEGQFLNGQFSGQGRMLAADGCEYVGQWVASCREGQGVEKWPNGNIYTGGFKSDKKDSYGMIDFYFRSVSVG